MKNAKLQVKSLKTAVVLYKKNIKQANKVNIPKEILKFIFDLKKLSRNEKCEATGKKFKNCCGAL